MDELDFQNSITKPEFDFRKRTTNFCKETPNGLRYLRVGGRGQCLGAEKTQSQKNAPKPRRLPHVRCTLC